jgi:hypothetical protein
MLETIKQEIESDPNANLNYANWGNTLIVSQQGKQDCVNTASFQKIGKTLNIMSGAPLFVEETVYRSVTDPATLQQAKRLSQAPQIKATSNREIRAVYNHVIKPDAKPSLWNRVKERMGF